MFAILLGVPGQLKTLTSRLTSTWAAKLDTLETRLSSLRAGYLDKLNLSGKCTDDAVWTNALATKLANLERPPIASSALNGSYIQLFSGDSFEHSSQFPYSGSNGLASTFVDIVNITGSGVLELCAHYLPADSTSSTMYLEVIIDGVTVVSTSSPNSTTSKFLLAPIGHIIAADQADDGSWKFSAVPGGRVYFNTSLQIRHRGSVAGGSSYVYYKYQRFS